MPVTGIRGAMCVLGLTLCGRVLTAQSPKIDPSWLRVDSAAHTATLTLVAGLTPANGGMNFDGFGSGHLTVNVPTQWTVVVEFRNADQMLPHSVEVIPESAKLPLGPERPAFQHAATNSLQDGIGPGGKQEFRFVSTIAGKFLLFCAVAGHGAAGMWIHLNVADGAAPSIEPSIVP